MYIKYKTDYRSTPVKFKVFAISLIPTLLTLILIKEIESNTIGITFLVNIVTYLLWTADLYEKEKSLERKEEEIFIDFVYKKIKEYNLNLTADCKKGKLIRIKKGENILVQYSRDLTYEYFNHESTKKREHLYESIEKILKEQRHNKGKLNKERLEKILRRIDVQLNIQYNKFIPSNNNLRFIHQSGSTNK